MKVTYFEEVESRTALNRDMFCPNCGSHGYTIHHQLDPVTSNCWWIECEDCGYESEPTPDRKITIARWKLPLC